MALPLNSDADLGLWGMGEGEFEIVLPLEKSPGYASANMWA